MNTERVQNALRKASPVALIVAGIVSLVVVAYAGASVYHLFSTYVGLSLVESVFATVASVGMSVGLLFVVVTTLNQNARGLGAILMIAWILLTLCMVALDSVMRADLLMAPDALLQIGQIIAALLPALALGGIIGMAIALHDTSEQKSAAGAASKYVGFAAKGVAIGASTFASSYFGISRGINPVLAVLCGALLESAFLWSYLALKMARDRGDRFDVRMWSFCTLVFGLFIAAVAVETVSTLGGIDVPIVSALGEVGATLYVSAVGLSLVLTVMVHLLTRAIDDVPAVATQTDQSPWSVRTANAIRGARAGAGEIGAAVRGQPARLPAPAPALAKDGAGLSAESGDVEGDPDENMRRFVRELMEERRAEAEREAAQHPKRSENGTPYDETAEIIMPTADLANHNSQPRRTRRTAGEMARGGAASTAQNNADAGASGPKSGGNN